MCVLAAMQFHWAHETEACLSRRETQVAKQLNSLHEARCLDLENLAGVVRGGLYPEAVSLAGEAIPGKPMRTNAYQTLQTAIILFVHARDLVIKLLESRVTRSDDFTWLRQLRYQIQQQQGDVKLLSVHAGNATLDYGYEYLGNASRLVVTPPTERACLSLVNTVNIGLGGALFGSPGAIITDQIRVSF